MISCCVLLLFASHDRDWLGQKKWHGGGFIASRLVRSRVRCFVDFSLRLSLWPGHAKAMDEWASIKLILHDRYYSPSSGWVSCLGGKKRNRQEETRERHNMSRWGQDLNVGQHSLQSKNKDKGTGEDGYYYIAKRCTSRAGWPCFSTV